MANPPNDRPSLFDFIAGFDWIAIDPMTRWRIDKTMIVTQLGCDSLATCHGVPIGGVQYQLYLLDPRSHAINSIQGASLHEGAAGQLAIGGGGPPPPAPLQSVAPEFTIAAGETIYAGNLTVDFGKPGWVGWSFGQDEAAARAFLAGTGLADRLVTRPLLRADGTPINVVDGGSAQLPRHQGEMPILQLFKD